MHLELLKYSNTETFSTAVMLVLVEEGIILWV